MKKNFGSLKKGRIFALAFDGRKAIERGAERERESERTLNF